MWNVLFDGLSQIALFDSENCSFNILVIEAELSQKDEPEEKTEPVGSDSSSSSSSSASSTDGDEVEQEDSKLEESNDANGFEEITQSEVEQAAEEVAKEAVEELTQQPNEDATEEEAEAEGTKETPTEGVTEQVNEDKADAEKDVQVAKGEIVVDQEKLSEIESSMLNSTRLIYWRPKSMSHRLWWGI